MQVHNARNLKSRGIESGVRRGSYPMRGAGGIGKDESHYYAHSPGDIRAHQKSRQDASEVVE